MSRCTGINITNGKRCNKGATMGSFCKTHVNQADFPIHKICRECKYLAGCTYLKFNDPQKCRLYLRRRRRHLR